MGEGGGWGGGQSRPPAPQLPGANLGKGAGGGLSPPLPSHLAATSAPQRCFGRGLGVGGGRVAGGLGFLGLGLGWGWGWGGGGGGGGGVGGGSAEPLISLSHVGARVFANYSMYTE